MGLRKTVSLEEKVYFSYVIFVISESELVLKYTASRKKAACALTSVKFHTGGAPLYLARFGALLHTDARLGERQYFYS